MFRIAQRCTYWSRGKAPLNFLPACTFGYNQRRLGPQPALLFTTSSDRNTHRNERNLTVAVGLLASSAVGYYLLKNKVAFAEKPETEITAGQFVKNLPTFSESDVAKHSKKEDKIWVIFKNGVYDVTEFVEMHPGGNKILLAAGSSIEPFWALYGVHHTPEVYSILEEYRIGNFIGEEKKGGDSKSLDPYASDPDRHPVLKPASVKPFNAEPPPSLLVDNFYTPTDQNGGFKVKQYILDKIKEVTRIVGVTSGPTKSGPEGGRTDIRSNAFSVVNECPIFYVRNHLPVPDVDISKFRLEIKGIGVKEKSLSLDEIKKFPKYTVSAVVQCAGNRRSEMTKVKPVKGLSWGHAAIGNATWTGARLTDVLKSCGLDLNRTDIQHVQFEGLDKGPENVPYGASVPAEKALDPKGDVILAYEMNGETLTRDHGYPLRVVVPGVVGARNVKWVSKITLSEKESDSHWQQNDYKGFSPSTDWDTVDFKTAPAIQELPVISAICVPEDGENVRADDGVIGVKGYAWSGGGKKIVRVDVSIDGGKTWHVAELEQAKDNASRHWAWSLWSVNVPIPEGSKTVEIWAKAVDSAYNTQPENFENIWNLRGVLANAYHKIKVNVSE